MKNALWRATCRRRSGQLCPCCVCGCLKKNVALKQFRRLRCAPKRLFYRSPFHAPQTVVLPAPPCSLACSWIPSPPSAPFLNCQRRDELADAPNSITSAQLQSFSGFFRRRPITSFNSLAVIQGNLWTRPVPRSRPRTCLPLPRFSLAVRHAPFRGWPRTSKASLWSRPHHEHRRPCPAIAPHPRLSILLLSIRIQETKAGRLRGRVLPVGLRCEAWSAKHSIFYPP